jgi:universal stress protein A
MVIKRILVGIDFSPQSEGAIDCALSLARAFDASVTLMHVYELPTMMNPIVPGADNLDDTVAERASAQTQLEALRATLRAHDPRVLEGAIAIDTLVAGGVPADVIIARARDGAYDLIVMGTHGRSGLKRLVLGSVAEAVLRGAGRPVVTVPLP